MGLCIIQIIIIVNERASTETRPVLPQLNAKTNKQTQKNPNPPHLKNKGKREMLCGRWNFCVAIAEWIVTFSKLLLIR